MRKSADSLGRGAPLAEQRKERQGVRVQVERLGVGAAEDVGGRVGGEGVDVFEGVFDEGGGLLFLFLEVVVSAPRVDELEPVVEELCDPAAAFAQVEGAVCEEEEFELLFDPPEVGVEEFDAEVRGVWGVWRILSVLYVLRVLCVRSA